MDEKSSLICALEGHDFNARGECYDCGTRAENFDPTPQGDEMVTDPADSPSYPKEWSKAA